MDEKRPSLRRDLHPLLFIGLPIMSLIVIWLAPLLGYEIWRPIMTEEYGFLETGTVIFLLPAIVLGIILFVKFLRNRNLARKTAVTMAIVMLLAGLAALYFAGEEISWGQTWLGFETPEGWAEINEQKEFNLHNLKLERYGPAVDLVDDLLNNIPRQMMLIASIVGGMILPLVMLRFNRKPKIEKSFWYWLIPNWRMVPIATLAACSTVPEKIFKKLLDIKFDPDSYVSMAFIDGAGEFKEFCFAMVMMFYVMSIYLRIRSITPIASAAMSAEKSVPQKEDEELIASGSL